MIPIRHVVIGNLITLAVLVFVFNVCRWLGGSYAVATSYGIASMLLFWPVLAAGARRRERKKAQSLAAGTGTGPT